MLKEVIFGGKGASDKLGDLGLLVLRVFTGLAMAFGHGLGKVQNPERMLNSTANMGIPLPQISGWLAIIAEFLGGILLALGILTRPAAFMVACTMVVAAFVAHGSDPFSKKELALFYLVSMIVFMCTGGGRFSLDALVRK